MKQEEKEEKPHTEPKPQPGFGRHAQEEVGRY